MPAVSLARVVFDEAHSEAWTIRPELARTMQPAHPGDSSYALAAAALAERDFEVAANVDEPLSAQTLSRCDVLVIAHPSDPAWERTTGAGSPRLTDDELDAIARVRTQDNGDLERLIMDLQRDGLVQRTRSQVVLSRLLHR